MKMTWQSWNEFLQRWWMKGRSTRNSWLRSSCMWAGINLRVQAIGPFSKRTNSTKTWRRTSARILTAESQLRSSVRDTRSATPTAISTSLKVKNNNYIRKKEKDPNHQRGDSRAQGAGLLPQIHVLHRNSSKERNSLWKTTVTSIKVWPIYKHPCWKNQTKARSRRKEDWNRRCVLLLEAAFKEKIIKTGLRLWKGFKNIKSCPNPTARSWVTMNRS